MHMVAGSNCSIYVTEFEKSRHKMCTLFTITWYCSSVYTLTNNSDRYWCWQLATLLLLWLASESCQISKSAQMVYKWLHLPWTSRQPTACNSPHDWLISLTMDLAALCVIFGVENDTNGCYLPVFSISVVVSLIHSQIERYYIYSNYRIVHCR